MFKFNKTLSISTILISNIFSACLSTCLTDEPTKLSQTQEKLLPKIVQEVSNTYNNMRSQTQENEKKWKSVQCAFMGVVFKYCKTSQDKNFLFNFFRDTNNQNLFLNKLKTCFIQIAFDSIERLKNDSQALQFFKLTAEECQAQKKKLLPLGIREQSKNNLIPVNDSKAKLVNDLIESSNIGALLKLTEQIVSVFLKQANNAKIGVLTDLSLHQKLIDVTRTEFYTSLSEDELNRLITLFKSSALRDLCKNLAVVAQSLTKHLNPTLSEQIYTFLSMGK
jgi:hypothetical protein